MYIVVALDDTGTISGYWDGTIFQSEIDNSDTYDTITDARFAQGSIQTQDTSFDVQYREATVNIALVP
ncbi:hypothetical protein [Sphaerospermopsis aphanizomenoides]|uniref:hypothetical protein n=1 Tax=Sphaerospermopsis aphanizomenoides TaxID=459663 RepID=UPI00190382DF|nr:hypothetical protein [Sphaerospermopsis aphanizomenoides]